MKEIPRVAITEICQECLQILESTKIILTRESDRENIIRQIQLQISKSHLLVRASLYLLYLPADLRLLTRVAWKKQSPTFFYRLLIKILSPVLNYLFCMVVLVSSEQEHTHGLV